MIMTFSHPNMTCVSEKRSFHESRKLILLNIKREFRAWPKSQVSMLQNELKDSKVQSEYDAN